MRPETPENKAGRRSGRGVRGVFVEVPSDGLCGASISHRDRADREIDKHQGAGASGKEQARVELLD